MKINFMKNTLLDRFGVFGLSQENVAFVVYFTFMLRTSLMVDVVS